MNDLPPAANPRILVVDDHPASRYATVRVLRNAVFDTLEAETGAEALAKATQAVDLIVLDINLPDMDGFEVCRRLRLQRDTAYIPVVHLSATFTNSVDRAHGLRAGADSYLTHPADPAVLVATIRALLFARDADAIRRRTDARFRTLFELTPSGIVLLTPELRFQDVNPAFCQLAGLSRDELVGRALPDIAVGEFEARRAEIDLALANVGRWEGLLPFARNDGSQGLSEWRIALEPDTLSRIAIVNDVTDRIRGERERERLLASERQARTEADHSNRLKDEFLAMLSHELRNPLSAILGWANVLHRMPALPPLVRQGVEAIERSSRVQSQLTSDLLDFAGIQFGKMRLDMNVIDPQLAVDAAVEIIANQARQKSIELSVTERARDCSVLGDETRLQQIVWNLLSNAVKFTPAGGRVTVASRVTEGTFEVEVADTGKGISPEFLPRLFERFSQQDVGRSKSFAGLGIGLSIVNHLVAHHRATIEAHSDGEGKGSTFKVRFPLTELPRRTTVEMTSTSLVQLDVLVVEDIDDSRALIVRLLSDAGARVRAAESGEEALRLIRGRKPDVLVSDIGMPRMDGYELIRAVRAAGYSAQALPAIALTAFVRSEEAEAALDAGFQMHLGKPINDRSLLDAIAQVHAAARVSLD